MEYKLHKLSELNEGQINHATAICVEGLYNIFSIISKDNAVLEELFKDSFDYGMNYACLHNEEVVGFIGLGDASRRATGKMKQETFERLFDKHKSKMMYRAMSSAFTKPKNYSNNEVEVEFFVTASHFRGKGVGTWIIHYLCANFPYEFCVLDVYSKNLEAKRFYERLGFEQVKIKSDWMLRLRGIGKTITMQLDMKDQLIRSSSKTCQS